MASIAKLLGVSRTTIYKYVPELAAGRDSLVPGSRVALP
ncbi:helix-turn-helix domain-containing protein [Streptomyces sp. NPDC048275]